MRDDAVNRESVHRLMAVLVLTGAVAVIGVVMANEQGAASKPASQAVDKWAQHYYDRVDQFKRENAAARNIVLVGSSHVEGFDAGKLLPGRRVVNRGIASDRIGIDERGILHRLDNSVFDCNPGVIIIENGVNDLGELWRNGTPAIDEIDACYREVVKRIRTRLPGVPLLIVGLFPTRDRYAGLKDSIVEFNGRLAKVAADYGCPFMDVYGPFADAEGLLRKELARDGLHLTPEGYKLWAEMIEQVLVQMDAPSERRPAEPRP